MKKYAIHLLLLTTAILILGSISYSQSSGPLTKAERAELISRCEKTVEEVVTGRQLIAASTDTIAKLEKQIADGEALGTLTAEELEIKKAEVVKLREALADKQTALEAKQKEVDIYKAQLAKEVKKKNFYKKIAKFSTVAAGVAIGILVIQNK